MQRLTRAHTSLDWVGWVSVGRLTLDTQTENGCQTVEVNLEMRELFPIQTCGVA